MLDALIALLLGLVEGLTEFLPVSSTAHLLLLGHWLGFDDPGGAFTVMIQLGAILAIILIYLQKIFSVVFGLPRDPAARRFAAAIVLAFLPAALAGVLLHDIIKQIFFETPGIIASALILGGIVMLVVERFRPPTTTEGLEAIPIWKSFLVGCCQAIALIPGVSRSGATIVGAMLLGIERRTAAEFSFFLAMPTMLGAFVYEVYKNRDALDMDRIGLIGIGFAGAFIAGLIVVRLFLGIVSKYGFAPFAWYRIALGLVIFGWLGMTGQALFGAV